MLAMCLWPWQRKRTNRHLAVILLGLALGKGSVVAAGAMVTGDVVLSNVVAGVPARPIGQRRRDLAYTPDYRRFLG